MPVHLLAANVNHDNLSSNKSEIINNKTPVKVAKPEEGKTAADLIENPKQPAIYTLRKDYKVQKGDKYEINYQPYIASVGEAASADEKAKVKKEITLPDLAGYDKSHLDDTFTITYDTVKDAANGKNETGDKTNGLKYSADEDFRYKAKSNSIKIKHLFQDMKDFTKYTNLGGEDKPEKITTQNGNTGSTMEVSPLNENDRKGFVPESDFITMRVPEDATDFVLEYRYNRAHYNVDFDTMGGTALPTRTYYYDQEIPKIEKENIPTKTGCDFLGWKPSHDLQTTDDKTYKAGQIINKADGKPALDLDVNLKMPALLLGKDIKSRERLKFTAVWKDKEKADYAIQFWAEKADHADGASLLDKYDYMGTRVYKDKDTGMRPELDKEPVNGLKFPDLDQARLNKIWANARFNRDHDLFLNKFYVYNKDLTADQNKDPANVNLVKSVDATGKTVYNIYYDRQVYDLYFTKSNAQPEKNTIYPEIWGYDTKKGESVMLGGPGKPYHYKARFNEMMYKWPNDAKQTKGFTPGYQSFGWGPNYTLPNWPLHLDTPPYRLNADEFLDMEYYNSWGGYTKHIDKGDGKTIDLDRLDFTTLSFGIKQDKPSIPHHMDFWMDGFKKDETIIRYDLVRTKADTEASDYGHRYPKVTGFTPHDYEPNNPQSAWPVIKEGSEENGRVNEDGINDLNDERDEITPNNSGSYYNNQGVKLPIGQLDFIPHFFSDADDFDDVKEGGQEFTENGYLQFHYKRNKYPLRFNYDPSKIKDDSEFNKTNSLETFYEFPLKVLSPDLVDSDLDRDDKEYFKDNPKNLLDNPENLKKLGLSDLVFTDSKDGKLKVKRPEGLSDQMVFKGWALDPAGTKLVWENPKETMPFHPLNLYAKWGEPDYKWKVTFDPDGGKLRNIKEENLTEKRKTIQEGDIGQEEVNTYAKKEAKDGDKQVFTVIQRQKLVEPIKPEKKGYDFMGWEVVRYKKNAKTGDYTDKVDTSYREKYGVPELYTFGNDVVGPVYLKAIWNPNQRVDVKVVHHILDKNCEKDKEITEWLEDKRTGYYTATVGDKQGEKLILAPNDELEKTEDENIKNLYKEYNDNFGFNNTYFQNQRIEPEKIKDTKSGEMIANPAYRGNEFHFFYRPFRQREYKVNYIDERYKGKEKEKGAAIIDQEDVSNGNRHFDARNYRPIPGWKLVSAPQQQLFFDVEEDTNKFLGINGTGKDEITFYYKDVRVIEIKDPKEEVPEGYVRVTFKADKGGSFGKDKDGKDITELHYDVIKGLKSDLLPVPQELGTKEDGTPNDKVEGKYYITPETGKKFIKWDEKPLLNKNTIVDNDTKDFYVFTAKFEWSGLSASGLVRTEAFKDPEPIKENPADPNVKAKDWSNKFAPTIDELKAQLVWREKDQVKDLPEGTEIKLYDEAGNELTKDEQVYELVNEKKAADKDELVRTVNVKAKVTFKDGKEPQELDIPITVYKNVYEALNKAGDKPLFLKEAEGKKAEEGGLSDVTGSYVKVTVAPTGDLKSKDNKVYYVNPKAWVVIPEVDTKDNPNFTNWTADKDDQNEKDKKNNSTGVYDFTKRHKFTEYTVISPRFSQTSELVAHESYKDSKNNWVNDFIDKELTNDKIKAAVQVRNGEAKPLGPNDTVTIVDDAGNPYADDAALKDALYEKLKEKDNGVQPNRIENIKVKVTFVSGEVQTLTVPVKVIKNVYQAKTEAGKPNYVPDGYVKVTLDPTTKAKDPQKYFYYVNPDAKVLIPGKDPEGVKEAFTRWTMKADSAAADVAGETYKLKERHQFKEASTITAQYEEGKIKIIYVDDSGKEIDPKYHIDGVEYPSEKFGKLNTAVNDSDFGNPEDVAPKFKGYFYISRDALKGKNYKDPADPDKLDIVKYQYYKKVTADTPSNLNPYFPVIFDANTGEFGSDPKNKKTVYVYFDPDAEKTVEKVTFEEARQAVEEKYGKPSKANENFIEWQNKAKSGSAVADDYEIQFKGWNWEADPTNGYVPETFYANYGKASALVKYLDLDGKTIADEFKISTEKYPTEKDGKAGDAIDKNVYAKDSAPKFTGYKFNRIELNPANAKYAMDNKATIKIYYEKLPHVIPKTKNDESEKPDGYVEVKFVPTDKAKDKTEKIFYVNPKKDVTIPVANPEAKATFTFKEWKMGANAEGATYTPSTAQKFTEKQTVITATYGETDNIIPYDPSATDPMPRPDGYVRVTFAADPGLKLTEQKAYYVKKNAGITLGNTELAKPKHSEETGYKFDKWDKEDSLVIEAADILVTAKATKLDKVIPEKDDKNNPNEKPEGYKEVTFVVKTGDESKGSITGVKKFYVNPTEYVTINPPATKAETGFEFGTWDKDATIPTVYDKDATITGSFNGLKDVIPKTKTDDSEKPAGYKTVTFVIDPATGGKIADKEVTVYYVNPAKKVTVPQPKTKAETGYEFDKWDQDTTTAKKYDKDITVKGNFKKLKDIIPSTNDEGKPNAKPEGYVTVTFVKGEHGKEITGQTVYYVNPKADPVKTLGDASIAKPGVKAETGYKFTGWNFADTKEILSDITVIAQYKDLDYVIPKTKDDDSEKPEGYITVTFVKGEHGKELTGQAVYYVNPNKAVVLKDKAPTAVPSAGYKFADWDTQIAKKIQYSDGDKITALYNELGDVIPQTKDDGSENTKPAGYLTVTFDKGEHGELSGKTVYYVKPNKEVTVPAPTVTPKTGWKQKDGDNAWDNKLTQTFTTDTKITAQYEELKDIIPEKTGDTINNKPEGYKTVKFVGVNGTLEGTTVYYVNSEKEVDFTKIASDLTKKPDFGYTEKGGTWSPETFKKKFTEDETTFKFTFKKLDDVIPEKNTDGTKNEQPEGYVKVTLIPTDKATDETKEKKVFFVNSKKEVTITSKPTGKIEKVNNIDQTYTFKGWKVTEGTIASWDNEQIKGTFIQDTEITAQYSTKLDAGKLVPAPVAKKNVVTPKGDTPKPEDLIENIPGSEKDPLPKGTKITYEEEPKIDNPGDSKAKVKIEYPNGKTVVVEVPIKVVDNVVPQTGKDKPLVPESYVKVVVDTTEKATANTKFEKTFWVKPNVEVTIPDILAPTGKQEKIGEVTKTNKFVKWKLEGSKPEKFYETKITDTFKDKESKIVATYEQDKNVEPKGKNNQWIPQGSKPSPKDFIKNPYNDDDPNNKDNLPPGTKFEFVGGDPDTQTPGKDKETTIKITYPNGETKEVPVKYNVTGDVVEQEKGKEKPEVPNNFVKVIVKTTDKATDETAFDKTFWVNPTKEVSIDVTNPTGKTVAADPAKVGAAGHTMNFSKWETEDKAKTWEDKIVGKFEKETTIIAKYSVTPEKIKDQVPTKDTVHTPQGKTPTVEEIKDKITPPEGKTISKVTIVENPDVNNPGKSIAKVIVEYTDGSSVGTNDKPLEVPVEVHKNIIPEAPGGQKPKDALDNYVKVIFKAGTGGKFEDTLTGNFIYYVSPEVEVDMTEISGKIKKTPDTGYFVNGEKWNNKDNKALKGTFTEDETVFEFVFDKSTDIVEKTSDDIKKPDGYVTVIFRADDHGKLEGDKTEKIYYVNPKAGIKLVELADGQTAGEKQLAVPKTVADKNYVFEKWYEAIDKNNPVTNNLEYVARFVKDGVTLTYEAGGAEGKVPEVVTVAQGTSVRLASAAGLTKKNAKFAGWKIGEKIYQAGDLVTLEESKTAVAQWTNDKNIIPYDPNEPITRPEGYVKVTFAADTGLKLKEQKAYYVKKNAGIKLGNAELEKPKYSEDTGYKFKEWDKKDDTVINTDIVVTAKATKLANVIPEKDGEGNPNTKPDGYKEVTFVIKTDDAAKGSITGVAKFYVNPNEYVTINPPATNANTGYEFGAWDKDATIPTVYKEDATITGSFNDLEAVIPKTKDDDSEKPEGYVTVTFKIEGQGGSIVKDEVKVYYVNPAKDVTVTQPKTQADTGYVFEKWDIDTVTTAKKYTDDTTVTGNFKKLDDIIPSTDENGKPNAKPEGYVTVTFDKGANGNLTGQTVYYVNPKAGKKLSDITKPKVSPETGYNADGWDKKDSQPITGDLTVIAQYEAIADVIPKTKKDDSEKPAGYIKVTFDTTEKGKIKDSTATTKVVFVNPNKAVVLKGFAPEVVANKGYEFERWDTSIEKPIQYKDGDTIKAIYKDAKSPDKPNPDKPNPDKPNPDKPNPDQPGDKPGDNPGGTTPGDKPGDKPGDQPGDKPGENPGAIPGTKPGVVEKHGNRYVERVAGKNRVHTAISTSKRFFKKSKYVIIADSGNYPDALTATVLAHVLDAPILLNNTRYLEDDVAREIVRLGASEVIIVGGHKSISENVKSQLGKFDANKVQRIWGRDRYVTSSELAYEIERLTGKVNKAIIASGENFPDALATAPLGSKEIAPILLVTRNQMDKKVSKALKDLNINKVYVAGGQNSVSKKLEAQLPQVIRRFSGQDRYETAILVASYTYPESKEVFVASGETFPDALVIGPVCARRKAPILLSKSTPVKVTDDYIEKSKIEYLYIIGGTNTIHVDTAHKYAIED